jgi:site-specific DNA recombinase
VQVVVVMRLDRFSRETHDHMVVRALLSKAGVVLRSVTEPIDETSMGRFMENITAAVAQFDNNVRSDRTKAGMKAAMESGQWCHKAPFGYLMRTTESGASLDIDPLRAPFVTEAFERMTPGDTEMKRVLDDLTSKGMRTVKGKTMTLQSFREMLKKPIYKGWIVSEKIGVSNRGSFSPLVSEDTFERVQRVMTGRGRTFTEYQRQHPSFPLRGVLLCGSCELPLTGSSSTNHQGKPYDYYSCRQNCAGSRVRSNDLHVQFTELVAGLRVPPGLLRLFQRIVRDVWADREAEATAVRKRAEKKLTALKEKKSALVDLLVRNVLDEVTYKEQVQVLDADIVGKQLEVSDARHEELDLDGLLNFAEYLMQNLEGLWMQGALSEKQRLQRAMFPYGVPYLNGQFGTCVTGKVFSMFDEVSGPFEGMASPTGFEPVSPP